MKNLSTYPASQFHERRMKGIGGSDIPAIMGVNPWKSPLDVYLDKLGESEPLEDNFPMRLGRAMEVTLRNTYMELHDVNVAFSGEANLIFSDGIFYHHPDGFTTGPEQHLWEAKSSSRYSAWKTCVPIEVMLQCQWGLMLSGLPKCVVSLSLGGREYREFEILPDEKVWASMRAAAHLFWMDHVEKKIPPNPSGSESDRVWLDGEFEEKESVCPLDAELVDLASQRLSQKSVIDLWTAKLGCTDQLIMNKMGDHSAAAGDNFRVTWKRPNPRKTLDKGRLINGLVAMGLTNDQTDRFLERAMKTSEQKRRFVFKEVDNAS